jgi:hypothetical protein
MEQILSKYAICISDSKFIYQHSKDIFQMRPFFFNEKVHDVYKNTYLLIENKIQFSQNQSIFNGNSARIQMVSSWVMTLTLRACFSF